MMTDTFLDYLANTMIYLAFAGFFSTVLGNRRPISSTVAGVVLMGFVMPRLGQIVPQPIMFAITIVFYVFYLWLCFGGSVKEKLIAFCLAYMAINLSQILAMTAMGAGGWPVMEYAWEYFLLSNLFTLAMLFFLYHIWKSISLLLSSVRFMTFFLLPLSQFAMLILVIFFFARSGDENLMISVSTQRWAAAIFCLVFVVSLVADGLFLGGMVRMARTIMEKERFQTLEKESELTYEYIKNMEGDIDEMRKYRHDFVNLLTAVRLSMEEQSQSGQRDALRLVSQISEEVSGVTGKRYCGCTIVNCILSHEERKLREKGVSCELRAELPERLGVSELDLCRLLTNLFDNAGQGCMMVEDGRERRVDANMRLCEGYLYVTVRNTCPPGKVDWRTAKEDKRLHGLGLCIVREIVRRNDGELIVSEEESAVSVTAVLRWKDLPAEAEIPKSS